MIEIAAILKKLNKEVNELRNSIIDNFQQIEDNNTALSIDFEPHEGAKNLDECMQVNRQLLENNQNALERQKALIMIYNNLADDLRQMYDLKDEVAQVKASDREELYDLAIIEEVPLNAVHPLYDDIEFVHRVMEYFERKEDYEKCVPLRDRLFQLIEIEMK
ncbi:MAG: hypothetical protein ACFB10_26910 [Salibacteraceae bacterium]